MSAGSCSPAGQYYSSAPLEGGLLVARPADDRLFVLNGSARFIWERLLDGDSEDDIPALVAANYGIELSQARKDFSDLLQRWQAEALLRPKSSRSRRYEIAGLAFDIHYHYPDVAEALMPILSHLETASSTANLEWPLRAIDVARCNGQIVLRENGIETLQTGDVDRLIETLLHNLFRFVSDNSEWLWSLHAAAVAGRDGCLLMPGTSGSGKSSLTAALLASGDLHYATDDLALLTGDPLGVIPVPMPLALKCGSWEALGALMPDLAAKRFHKRFNKNTRYWAPARDRLARTALRVRTIVFPTFSAGAPLALTPLAPIETVSRLARAPSAVRPPIDSAVLDRLSDFVGSVPAHALTFGNLAEAADVLRDLLHP